MFYARSLVSLMCLVIAFYALRALNFEKLIKPGHVIEARVLYGLIMVALAYTSAQFLLLFIR